MIALLELRIQWGYSETNKSGWIRSHASFFKKLKLYKKLVPRQYTKCSQQKSFAITHLYLYFFIFFIYLQLSSYLFFRKWNITWNYWFIRKVNIKSISTFASIPICIWKLWLKRCRPEINYFGHGHTIEVIVLTCFNFMSVLSLYVFTYDTHSFLLPSLKFHVFSKFIVHCMINMMILNFVELMTLSSYKMIHQSVKYCWVPTTKVMNPLFLYGSVFVFPESFLWGENYSYNWSPYFVFITNSFSLDTSKKILFEKLQVVQQFVKKRLMVYFIHYWQQYILAEVTYNPGQNIRNKIEKSSKTGQDKKSLISTFVWFLTAIAKI